MVQRGIGLDAVGQQFVDQPVVEVEALGIWRAGAVGKYPRPRDREPVVLDAEIPDQADVFLVAMVVIVGAVPGRLVLDLARRVRKSVPDRAAAAVFIDGALDLIGRRGGAPRKTFGKAGGGVRIGGRLPLGAGRMSRRRPPFRARQGPQVLQIAGARMFWTSSLFRRPSGGGQWAAAAGSSNPDDCFKFCRLQPGFLLRRLLGARDDLGGIDEAQRDQ